MKDLIEKQNKWVEEQIKDMSEHKRDNFFTNIHNKIPLKLMPIIDENILMKNIDLKNWRKYYLGYHKSSSYSYLCNAQVWLWENSHICYEWQFDTSRKWNIFYCENKDWYLRYQWCMDEMMTECLVNILLDD